MVDTVASIQHLRTKTIAACRACGCTELEDVFSLGELYPSDFTDTTDWSDREKVPLELVLCTECTLVQLRHSYPSELMWSGNYWYRSGVTDTMQLALGEVIDAASSNVELKSGDVVLDIGSNDGTLLRTYNPELDIVRVGVEPAKNFAETGAEGVDVFINDFWSYEAYERNIDVVQVAKDECDTRKAKIITAIGMLYDLDNPTVFIADIAKALHPDGIFIAQFMTLEDMLATHDLGNICHEHYEYYTALSLERLLGKCGLVIVDQETVDVNVRSTRFYIKHKASTNAGEAMPPLTDSHKVAIAENTKVWCRNIQHDCREFHAHIRKNRRELKTLLANLVAGGKTVGVYGASTKGNTLLQYYGIDTRFIQCAAERSPEKYGKYTVGTGIPIRSDDEARSFLFDYMLVLPYTFIDEFIEREKDEEWRKAGGKFIVPLPEVQIL